MTPFQEHFLLSCVGLASVLMTPPVLGQEQITDTVDTIVVTAARIPIEADMISSSHTIITAEDIEAKGAAFIADILRSVTGVSIASSGPAGNFQQLRMRGAEANQTLVLIDGIRLNDPAFADEVQFEHISLESIERIEIIRGPQSALWGTDAVAGVINIITKKRQDQTQVSGFARGGSFGRVHMGADLSAGIEKGYFAFSGTHLDQAGSNIARTGTEKDGYRNSTLNLTGGLEITSNWQVNLTSRYESTNAEFDGIDFVNTGLPVDEDQETETDKIYLSLRSNLEQMEGRLRHEVLLAYVDTNIKNFLNDGDNGSTFSESLTAEYEISYDVVDGHTLTGAVDYEKINFSQRGMVQPFGDPNQDQEIDILGFVADYVGRFDALTLFLSVRHDDNSDFKDVVTWRAGLNIPVGISSALRANVGKAQKIPTFTDRFGFFPADFVGNPNLKPETSIGFDIGFDHTFQGNGASFSLTYFESRLRDEIDGFVFDPATFLFTAENLSGKSRRRGIEAEYKFPIAHVGQFRAHYSFIASRQPDGAGGFERELRRPRHRGGVELDLGQPGIWGVVFGADYTGKSLDTFFPPLAPAETVILDDYVLGRLSAWMNVKEGVKLTLTVENLFDTGYEDVFGFQTPGIGVFAGLGGSF